MSWWDTRSCRRVQAMHVLHAGADEFMPMWRGGSESEEDEEDRRGAPVAIEIDFAGDSVAGMSSKLRDGENGDMVLLGGANEGLSLPWRSSAWSGSTRRMRSVRGCRHAVFIFSVFS